MRLILASGNPHKTDEVRGVFAPVGIEIVAAGEVVAGWGVEETGATLLENARIKARAATAATGEAAIADDTGLFVDALGGAPGVHASRYAGPRATYDDNVRKLLAALRGVPADRRTARFRTVAILVTPDGREAAFEGVLEGLILEERRGEHGFGYDPVFLVPELGRTLAEMEIGEKNRISHRAKAFGDAAAFLERSPGWPIALEPRVGARGAGGVS